MTTLSSFLESLLAPDLRPVPVPESASLAYRNVRSVAPPAGPRRRKQLERGRGFQVSRRLRQAVDGHPCAVCAQEPVDPAHLIPRSLAADFDDPRSVIPLCRYHHSEFDRGTLDLLPYLEPRFRQELAFAVERVGLLSTLERVTNTHWTEHPA